MIIMSSNSAELDALAENRDNSPVPSHQESPSNTLSSRIQEEYSELLRYAVGMPAADRRTIDNSGHAFQPVIRSGSSSARQTPIDQQHDSDSLKSQGNGGQGNTNSNSLHFVCPPRTKSQAATRGMDMNVSRNDGDEGTSACAAKVVNTINSTIIEPAVLCMSCKLDSWLGKLKCDILDEFKCLTAEALENQKLSHQMEIQEINCEKQRLAQEVNRFTEMVHSCEQSMSRKDTVIENMTQALGKQRDKVAMAQAFYRARAEHAEAKREKFTECLARQHNARRLCQKVLRAWCGLLQNNWKCRLEQVYDQKAQDVCKQLSLDYEDKIRALNEEIECVTRKLRCMQSDREQYALHVKKAFMRGVCALNMETMSAFMQDETLIGPFSDSEENTNTCNINNNLESSCPQKDDNQVKNVPSEITVSAMSDTHFDDRQFGSLTVVGTSHPQQSKVKSVQWKPRPSTAPSVSSSQQTKAWGISQTLAPPMASVVVERHDPVTKQTVGKAVASRYPKHGTSKNSVSHIKHKHSLLSSVSRSLPVSHAFQPLAGQSPSVTPSPGIKVVE